MCSSECVPEDGVNRVLEYLEVGSKGPIVLYASSFLVEPAAWSVAVMTYASVAPVQPHGWFLAFPARSQQALAIKASHPQWHVVSVPKPPIITAIVRDVLLVISSYQPLNNISLLTIHERSAEAGTQQRCRFEIRLDTVAYLVGLFEDARGPYYLLLSMEGVIF